MFSKVQVCLPFLYNTYTNCAYFSRSFSTLFLIAAKQADHDIRAIGNDGVNPKFT